MNLIMILYPKLNITSSSSRRIDWKFTDIADQSDSSLASPAKLIVHFTRIVQSELEEVIVRFYAHRINLEKSASESSVTQELNHDIISEPQLHVKFIQADWLKMYRYCRSIIQFQTSVRTSLTRKAHCSLHKNCANRQMLDGLTATQSYCGVRAVSLKFNQINY